MSVRFGDFVLDSGARLLVRGDAPRHVGPKAFDLLELLLSLRPNVVAKERIRDRLWPGTFVTDSTVATVVAELRSALDEDPKQPRFIRTVHGVGYAFCGEATESQAPERSAVDSAGACAATSAVAPGVLVKSLLALALRGRDQVIASLGVAQAAEILGRCESLMRAAEQRHGGIEVDRSVVLFERPISAVRCALEAQQAVSQLAADESLRLTLSSGVHLGEVFLGEGHAEGLTRVTAERLCTLAEGNQTLLSRAAFDLARRAAKGDDALPDGATWLAHGAYGLDGVEDVFDVFEVFEVGVVGRNPLVPPAGDATLSRVIAAADQETLGWRPAAGIEVPGRERWELVEKLADGGFGEVWLARHQKTGERRVFKFCFAVERLRGLKREVTLFRLLKEALGERDDIAKVLDWSFDKAPYFLEAEYTEGGSLPAWAQRQGGIDRVPLGTRLELVAQVSEALAAAHSVGVLHKDVKPANVLVNETDVGPRAQLTDFGIGLVQDHSVLANRGFTVSGFTQSAPSSSLSGTRLYMAPELLEGKPSTTLADVYALGVMLYQVVVGDLERALAPGWERDVEDELMRDDIAACVDGRPERRLGNALRLAEKLRALPNRRTERAQQRQTAADAEAAKQGLSRAQRKWRLAAVVASVATLFLFVVSLFALKAERARREAERDRQRAVAARRQADGLLRFMLGDLKAKLEPLGRVDLLGPVVEKALDYYKSLPAEEASDETELVFARTLMEAGTTRFSQGEGATKILEVQKRALEILNLLQARRPENRELQAELAAAYRTVSSGLWSSGEWDAAATYAARGIDVAERLAAADPDPIETQLLRANLYLTQGHIQGALGDFALSARNRLQAFEIANEVLAHHPDDIEVQQSVLGIWQHTSWALLAVGNRERVLRDGPAMVALAKRLAQQQPQAGFWVAGALEGVAPYPAGLAGALLEAGDFAGALSAYKEAEVQRRVDVARDPANVADRLRLAQSLTFQADVLRRQGQLSRARLLVDEAAHLVASGVPDETYLAAILRSGVLVREGQVRAAQGDQAGARNAWRKALDLLRPYERSTHGEGGCFHLVPLVLLDQRDEARSILKRLRAGGFQYKEMLDLAHQRGLLAEEAA